MKNTARQVSPTSTSTASVRAPRSRVLRIELTEFIRDTDLVVRQTERMDLYDEQSAWGGARGRADDAFEGTARGHRGLTAPGAPPVRAVAHRGRPPRRDRQVHAVPAGVRRRQSQPGDAVGDLRRAGRAVLPAARPAAPAHPGHPG